MLKRHDFMSQLVDSGMLVPGAVKGIYAFSGEFESVVAGVERLARAIGKQDTTETLFFPPAMSRAQLEESDYLRGFPHLLGTVHHFCGDEHDHRALLNSVEEGHDWTKDQKAGDLVLTPAACYPVYGIVARRGRLPKGGATILLSSYCFRREPSDDPGRLQMFRMLEYVRMGTPEEAQSFRTLWLERAGQIAEMLALPATIELANDPFFGRSGRIVANSQRELALKYELLVRLSGEQPTTACMSFNYHQGHFASKWGIACSDGSQAHTACVGFGLERIALALVREHGFDLAKWPRSVRGLLWS
jgi:seryl-tRNA synthetase